MFGRSLLRLKSSARAFGAFLLETATARLIIIARALWANLPLLSIIVASLVIACLVAGGLAGRGVFNVLAPAGLGAVIAAAIAALLVLELCSAAGRALIETALQLADDTGRHRVHALLTIASAGALAMTALALWRSGDASPSSLLVSGVAAASLWTLTIWFQRTYRRPAHAGFRDFRGDIAEARHFLMRAAHGG